jgi:hypothetical protein
MGRNMTDEQKEMKMQEILAEFPTVTREQLEEWDKLGSPMTQEEYWEITGESTISESGSENLR